MTATDGTNSTTQSITVSVTNLNDNSPVFTSSASLSANENHTPNLNDQKKDDLILSYSISGIIKHALGKRMVY